MLTGFRRIGFFSFFCEKHAARATKISSQYDDSPTFSRSRFRCSCISWFDSVGISKCSLLRHLWKESNLLLMREWALKATCFRLRSSKNVDYLQWKFWGIKKRFPTSTYSFRKVKNVSLTHQQLYRGQKKVDPPPKSVFGGVKKLTPPMKFIM